MKTIWSYILRIYAYFTSLSKTIDIQTLGIPHSKYYTEYEVEKISMGSLEDSIEYHPCGSIKAITKNGNRRVF